MPFAGSLHAVIGRASASPVVAARPRCTSPRISPSGVHLVLSDKAIGLLFVALIRLSGDVALHFTSIEMLWHGWIVEVQLQVRRLMNEPPQFIDRWDRRARKQASNQAVVGQSETAAE